MYEQVITQLYSLKNTLSNDFDSVLSIIDTYLSNVDNLRMASILLMAVALLLFLLLIAAICIKNIITYFCKPSSSTNIEENYNDDIFNEEDAIRLNQIIEDQERERELEKELQKELELARSEREISEQKNQKEKDKLREAEQKQKSSKKENKNKQRNKEKNISLDLDWKKGKTKELDAKISDIKISSNSLSYHQNNQSLGELVGLIIDMLGRGVDELKIAQTVMYRNHYTSSEEDVFQLIDAVKDFIQLCRSQTFRKLENYNYLPNEEEALFHLAEGDPSLALTLIENLMDDNIDKAAASGMENKKTILYQETSNLANTFGNLAATNDIHLATSSFELSIELSPQNISSWSRLADMYARAESSSKAIWAYQNILDIADGEINAREVANACKHLSQHLYAQGNSLQAAKLYNNSKQYYDSLGINRRLDKQEIEIIEIIEANHQDEIRSTIYKLLGKQSGSDFSI